MASSQVSAGITSVTTKTLYAWEVPWFGTQKHLESKFIYASKCLVWLWLVCTCVTEWVLGFRATVSTQSLVFVYVDILPSAWHPLRNLRIYKLHREVRRNMRIKHENTKTITCVNINSAVRSENPEEFISTHVTGRHRGFRSTQPNRVKNATQNMIPPFWEPDPSPIGIFWPSGARKHGLSLCNLQALSLPHMPMLAQIDKWYSHL